MKIAAPKPSSKKLALAQARRMANSSKKAGWSAEKSARRSGLFAFADAKNVRVLVWPEL